MSKNDNEQGTVITMLVSKVLAKAEDNTRKSMAMIDELAGEIAEEGQLTPMLVRPVDDKGKHVLVAGFRRLAAL